MAIIETSNYHLRKPAAGDVGVAGDLNWNLDTIDGLIKTINDYLAGIPNALALKASLAAHQALAEIVDGKAEATHSHAEYVGQTEFADLADQVATMIPDLASVALNGTISNHAGGLNINVSVNPSVPVATYMIEIEYNSAVVCNVGISAGGVHVSREALAALPSPAQIQVKITAMNAVSSQEKAYTHTYVRTAAPWEAQIEDLQSAISSLTVESIVAGFLNSDDAMTALANYVHSSNTLAAKVAERLNS
jgi:uncharacterized protein YukE